MPRFGACDGVVAPGGVDGRAAPGGGVEGRGGVTEDVGRAAPGAGGRASPAAAGRASGVADLGACSVAALTGSWDGCTVVDFSGCSCSTAGFVAASGGVAA